MNWPLPRRLRPCHRALDYNRQGGFCPERHTPIRADPIGHGLSLRATPHPLPHARPGPRRSALRVTVAGAPLGFGQAKRHCGRKEGWRRGLPPRKRQTDRARVLAALRAAPPLSVCLVSPPSAFATWQVLETDALSGLRSKPAQLGGNTPQMCRHKGMSYDPRTTKQPPQHAPF